MSGFREENIRVRLQQVIESDDIKTALQELIQLTKQQAEITQQAALSARTGSIQQVTAIEGIIQALKDQQKAQKASDDEASNSRQKANTELDALGKQVRNFATLVAAAFTFNEIKTFGLDIIDAKTKIDSVKIALDTMIGSKKESAELYVEIVKLAKETPFTLEQVSEQVAKLKAYNISTQDLIPTITALGNIAAAVGSEKLPQLTLAYGQVANAGRLMGTELKQFTEAGVPLLDLIAISYGKTKDAVVKMAADHEISFAMVKKAIADASAEGGKYAGLMEQISKTVGGQVSNLADTFFIAKGRIGDFFETTIRGGTSRLNDLITAVAGSNSAISRSLDIIKSVASAFITYQVATNASAVASSLLAGYEAAKNVLYGAYLLTLRAVTAQQIVYTAAQTESIVAAQSFGAVLAANPIGAVAAAVGVLVTAFYAYKAITDEVTTALGEQEIKLKSEKAELNGMADAAMNAAMGTKERKDAIDGLIKKYPEYFAGINSEKITNNQLKEILDKVNDSYEKRITLARQAYQLETISEKEKQLLEFEKNFFDSLPKEIGVQFGGNIQKFVDTLKEGGTAAATLRKQLDDFAPGGADFFGGVAKNAAEKFDATKKSYADLNSNMQQSDKERVAAAVETENIRWKNQQAALKVGSKAYQEAETAHTTALAKINGTYQAAALKDTIDHSEKTKQVTLVSANEIAEIVKGADADTLAAKIKSLQAQEKVEIDNVNKVVVSRKASAEQLASLEEKAKADILAIHEKYQAKQDALRQAAVDTVMKATVAETDLEKEAASAVANFNTESAKKIKKNQEDLEKAYEHTTKLKADLVEVEAKQQNASAIASYILTADTEQKKHDIIVELGKKTGDDLAVMEVARLKDRAYEAGLAVERAQFTYGLDSENYRKAVDLKLVADKDYSVAATALQTQLSDKLVQIWQQQEQRKKQLLNEAIQGMVQALQTFEQSTQQIRDNSLNGLKTELTAELAAAGDNFEKRKQIIDQYDAHVQEALYSANALAKVTNFLSSALTAFQGYTAAKTQIDQNYSLKVQEIETIKNLSIANGQTESIANAIAADDQKAASNEKTQQKIAAQVSAVAGFVGGIVQQGLQMRIQADQAEIESATKVHDATIALLEDKYAKEKAVLDKTTQDNLDASTTQFNNSKRILDEELTDRLTKLTSARNQEIADVNAEYAEKERLAAGNSAEIQRLEDEKGQKLQSINKKYDDAITTAKDDAGKAQTALLDNYTAQQKTIAEKGKDAQVTLQQTLNAAKKSADDDYNNKVRELQRDQFNAQRDMAKASIAVSLIQGAAQLFAINPILGIIGAFAAVGAGAYLFSKLNEIPNPYDGSTSSGGNLGGVNGDGAIAFDSTGKPIYGFDANGNPQYKNEKGELVTVDNEPQIKKQWKYKKTQLSDDQTLLDQLTILIRENSAAAVGSDYYNETKSKIDKINNDHPNLAGEIARIQQEISDLEKEMTKQGIPFFLGTPYLDLGKNPAGRDTIPAHLGGQRIRLNEGERIIPTADNLEIGGRGLSNKQLIEKVKAYDRFMSDFPKYRAMSMIMPEGGYSQLRLPDSLMSKGTSIDISGIQDGLKRVESAIMNKKLLAVNIDNAGFYSSIESAGSKVNYYANLQQQRG
ncbi:hypothetical protein GCM10028808_73100 [Spirosoma migulaei]